MMIIKVFQEKVQLWGELGLFDFIKLYILEKVQLLNSWGWVRVSGETFVGGGNSWFLTTLLFKQPVTNHIDKIA